jgi:DUF4097 and DUF4098 domain-containing protein YvlB
MQEFPASQPVNAEVRTAGGQVTITAEPRETVAVDVQPYDGSEASREAAANTRVEMNGDRLVVETPDSKGWSFRWGRGFRIRIEIRIPQDSRASVSVSSADVSCSGRLAALKINTASGDVRAEEITGDTDINTASGDVRLGRVGGALRVNTASGDLMAEAVGGEVVAHSASGDISIESADASAKVNTASGDINLGATRHGQVKVNSASGDVLVGVRQGTGVWLDLSTMSGSTSSDLNHGGSGGETQNAELTLQVRTMSGDIRVQRVAA